MTKLLSAKRKRSHIVVCPLVKKFEDLLLGKMSPSHIYVLYQKKYM